jgi:hypothetical protein
MAETEIYHCGGSAEEKVPMRVPITTALGYEPLSDTEAVFMPKWSAAPRYSILFGRHQQCSPLPTFINLNEMQHRGLSDHKYIDLVISEESAEVVAAPHISRQWQIAGTLATIPPYSSQKYRATGGERRSWTREDGAKKAVDLAREVLYGGMAGLAALTDADWVWGPNGGESGRKFSSSGWAYCPWTTYVLLTHCHAESSQDFKERWLRKKGPGFSS